MDIIKQYHWVIGLLLLAFVIIAMLGSPDTFLGQGAFIHNNLSDPKQDQTFVRMTLNFGDAVELQKLPLEISDWQGVDYEEEGLQEQLGADVMLMRAYTRPGLYQPVFFLAMQSKSESSFHPPEVCYRASGWEIVEQANDAIETTDAVWEKNSKIYGDAEKSTSLPARRLVITKETTSGEAERRVVVYFYVKPASFGVGSNEVNMIRVSAIAPASGSYQEILDIEKELITDFIPRMFEPREKEDLILVQLIKGGLPGVLGLIGLFAIPLTMIFYPQILRSLRRQ